MMGFQSVLWSLIGGALASLLTLSATYFLDKKKLNLSAAYEYQKISATKKLEVIDSLWKMILNYRKEFSFISAIDSCGHVNHNRYGDSDAKVPEDGWLIATKFWEKKFKVEENSVYFYDENTVDLLFYYIFIIGLVSLLLFEFIEQKNDGKLDWKNDKQIQKITTRYFTEPELKEMNIDDLLNALEKKIKSQFMKIISAKEHLKLAHAAMKNSDMNESLLAKLPRRHPPGDAK